MADTDIPGWFVEFSRELVTRTQPFVEEEIQTVDEVWALYNQFRDDGLVEEIRRVGDILEAIHEAMP